VSLVSILKIACIGLNTAVLAPVIAAVAAVDERQSWWLSQVWAQVNLWTSGVRVRVHFAGALDPNAPYVFMSNHRSHFDVLALAVGLDQFQLRWVAKKELTRVPIFGWALRHTGHVIVDRGDHAQAMASMRAAEEKMRSGISVIIFPEGTRAPTDDALLPFKRGGFVLAHETGIPIVPVGVRGSRAVLPPHGRDIAAGEIEVVVGTPIEVEGRDLEELMAVVRSHIERLASERAAAEPPRAEAS
jgi:1-acyl-sn-glycerol-3-phosphate acyltransferase